MLAQAIRVAFLSGVPSTPPGFIFVAKSIGSVQHAQHVAQQGSKTNAGQHNIARPFGGGSRYTLQRSATFASLHALTIADVAMMCAHALE
eukprot:5018029-Prymnesium_polylepis.1